MFHVEQSIGSIFISIVLIFGGFFLIVLLLMMVLITLAKENNIRLNSDADAHAEPLFEECDNFYGEEDIKHDGMLEED